VLVSNAMLQGIGEFDSFIVSVRDDSVLR
jgi:hypothetical protein